MGLPTNTHTQRTYIDPGLCPSDTHRQQVDQVGVGIDVGWGVLDESELLQNRMQLLRLGQVHPRLLFVDPIWQRHVHGDEVLEVHAKDGKPEARALRETLAVMTVVPTRCNQFNETVENLQRESMFCSHTLWNWKGCVS